MKRLLTFAGILLAGTVVAQQQGMTPEMRQMIENMQKNLGQVQSCMADIDQKAMEDLQARTKEMEAEVKKLCAAGERDAAQRRAIEYGREIGSNAELQKMRRCGEGYNKMPMPGQFFPKDEEEQKTRKHICD
jgi:superfamily II RNA helicase